MPDEPTTDADDMIFLHDLIATRITDPTADVLRPLIDRVNKEGNPTMAFLVMMGIAIAELADVLTLMYGEDAASRLREVGIGTQINAIFVASGSEAPSG